MFYTHLVILTKFSSYGGVSTNNQFVAQDAPISVGAFMWKSNWSMDKKLGLLNRQD